jgi:hypothetical protein
MKTDEIADYVSKLSSDPIDVAHFQAYKNPYRMRPAVPIARGFTKICENPKMTPVVPVVYKRNIGLASYVADTMMESWHQVMFYIPDRFNLPAPTIGEVEEMMKDLVATHGKRNYRKIKNNLMEHMYALKTFQHGVVEATPQAFVFDIKYSEIEWYGVESKTDRPFIKYNLGARLYRDDGFARYYLQTVHFYPHGRAAGMGPSLYVVFKKGAQEFSHYANVDVITPAPIYTPFSPREEAITQLKAMGMDNDMIHHFDGVIWITKYEERGGIPDLVYKPFLLHMLHSMKYRWGASRQSFSLKALVISDEDYSQENNSTTVTFVWRDNYIRPPSEHADIADKLSYQKYYESLPKIRW